MFSTPVIETQASVKDLVEKTLLNASYDCHPASQLVPFMSPDRFAALKADVRENQLRFPVWLDRNGKIIDGRHRLAAALLEGVELTDDDFIKWYEMTDEEARLVVSQANLNRRQLAPSQAAMLAAVLKKAGIPVYEQQSGSLPASGESIARAERVLSSGNKQIIELVETGNMSLTEADRIVTGKASRDEMPTEADLKKRKTEPRKRAGRPQGNTKVNKLTRLSAQLAELVAYQAEIVKHWPGDADQLETLKICAALLDRLITRLESLSDVRLIAEDDTEPLRLLPN